MNLEPVADPFGLRADPNRYVPRPATESALDELERGVLLANNPVVLLGPAGIGKTLLLRVLAQRLSTSYRAAYLPYPLLAPRDLCRWALMELDEPAASDPEAALLAAARRGEGRDLGILLLIDDADALPLATAERLFELFHQCDGDLRIVLAAADQERAERVFARNQDELAVVRLAEPMSRAETATWLRGHVAELDDASRARFDESAIDSLHGSSGGLPGPLQTAATAVLRGESLSAARAPAHALAEIESELVAAAPVEIPAAPSPAEIAIESPPPEAPHVEAEEQDTTAEPGSSPSVTIRPRRSPRRSRRSRKLRLPARQRKEGRAPVIAAAVIAAGFAGAFALTLAWPSGSGLFGGDKDPALEAGVESRGTARIDVAAPPPGLEPRPATPKPRREDRTPKRPAVPVPAEEPELTAEPVAEAAAGLVEAAEAAAEKVAIDAKEPVAVAAEATRKAIGSIPSPEVEAPRERAAEAKPAPVPEAPPVVRAPEPEAVAAPPPRVAPEPEIAAVPEPTPVEPTGTAAPIAAPVPETPPPVAAAPPAPTPKAKPKPAPRGPLIAVDIEAPEGARIEIDGRSLGEAPLAGVQVRAGRRRIVARLSDGSVMQRTVEISGERDSVIFY